MLSKKIMPALSDGTVDIKNCKYVEEFIRAGIPQDKILYAYTNASEFIAVAMTGDTAAASGLDNFSNAFTEVYQWMKISARATRINHGETRTQ